MYLCTLSYLKINVTSESLVLSSCISCILLLVSPVQASSSNQLTYLRSICRCIFSPFGIYPDGTFHRARQRRLPYFPGKKNPSGIAGNGVSTTCCTPRQGTRKADPPRFLCSFLILFYFPKSCCTLFQTRPRLFSSQHSIYF